MHSATLSPSMNFLLSLTLGSLEVRLSRTPEEVYAAQQLRYRIFFEDLGAQSSNPAVAAEKRDFDAYDAVCDHLIVVDHAANDKIVATYRLIQRQAAEACGGFYTASEFDITPLLNFPGPILELGRACIDPLYRNRPLLPLLWNGLKLYTHHFGIEVLFGCGSFPTTDPLAIQHALSKLHYESLAPQHLRPKALAKGYIAMDSLPPDRVDPALVIQQMPTLAKGYLRLGAWVGEGAFLDREFRCIDVCIVFSRDQLIPHYGIDDFVPKT